MRLRFRLSLTLTAVTAIALLASFAAVYLLVRRDEIKDLDHALAIQAHRSAQLAMASDPAHPVVDDGTTEVPDSINPTARYVAVYGPDGATVTATRSFGQEAPPFEGLGVTRPIPWEGAPVNLTVAGHALRGMLVPMGPRGHLLLYAASRHSVDDDTTFLNHLLSAIFMAATALTSLVARWLGSRLASDVDEIAKVARSVAEGDMGARVGIRARRSIETRALAADLDHMIERLDALVSAQRTFISHAAHELRSPLATLRGALELALRRPREAAEYRQTIEDVIDDVDALTRLAEDLLTLARVEAGASAEQRTSIGDAVRDALRMARGPAEARGVTLREIAAGGDAAPLAMVPGPRGEVARVLRNLIDNAVTHSPEGGTVMVTVARDDGRVCVAVSDEGPGISQTDAPHIFTPFFRGERDQGDEVGAGLGLTIAQAIARRHGGDVVLDRAHVGGARLVLDMPLSRSPAGSTRRG